MPDMVVTDIDKTLLDPGARESNVTIEFFTAAKRSATPIGFASSRPLSSIAADLPSCFDLADFAICADGGIALVVSPAGLETIHRATLTPSALIARILGEILPSEPLLEAFLFLDDREDFRVAVHSDRGSKLVGQILGARRTTAWDPAFAALLSAGSASESRVLSIGLLAERDVLRRVQTQLGPLDDSLQVRTYPELRFGDTSAWWLDISSALSDKVHALASVVRRRRLHSPQVVVLGDGENDVKLAQSATSVLCPPWAVKGLTQLTHSRVVEAESCDQFVSSATQILFGGAL